MPFGFFKQSAADAAAAIDRYNDKESAEAMVAILLGTSYADGDLEPAEKTKIVDNFKKNPLLKKYDYNVLQTKYNFLMGAFDLDVIEGEEACLKELREVAKSPIEKKQAIMRAGAMAAKADGDFEESEKVFLGKCCDALGLTRSDFGL